MGEYHSHPSYRMNTVTAKYSRTRSTIGAAVASLSGSSAASIFIYPGRSRICLHSTCSDLMNARNVHRTGCC